MCDHVPSIPVRFDVGVPEEEYRYIPILWGKGGHRVKMVITSHALTSCMTHWIDGRTRPCYSPVAPCNGCKAQFPRLWKGFLGGICYHSGQEVIAMFTPHAVRPWKKRLAGEGKGVRGYLLSMTHEQGSRMGKVHLDLSAEPMPGNLPPPIDVESQLKGMWMRSAAARDPNDEDRWEMIPIPGE